MSRQRLRFFIPYKAKGWDLPKVIEIGEREAHKLSRAPRTEWRPFPIDTGTVDGVTMVYVRFVWGPRRVEMVTTQARRVAEASIWVSMVHAIAVLGLAGMAAEEEKAAA